MLLRGRFIFKWERINLLFITSLRAKDNDDVASQTEQHHNQHHRHPLPASQQQRLRVSYGTLKSVLYAYLFFHSYFFGSEGCQRWGRDSGRPTS